MDSENYVKKYNLLNTFYFDRKAFAIDLMKDFDAMIGERTQMAYDEFQDMVTQIRVKWDNIFYGSRVSLEHSDKFWGFIYATEIAPRRQQLVPKKTPPEAFSR